MTLFKIAALAAGMSLALVTFANAQATPAATETVEDEIAVFVHPKTKKMRRVKASPKAQTVLKQVGRELPEGTVVYRSKGKIYLIENVPTGPGKMLMDNRELADHIGAF